MAWLWTGLTVGCGAGPRGAAPISDQGVRPEDNLGWISAARPPEAVAGRDVYRFQVGDDIEVNFFYNPSLTQRVFVRPDGRVSLLRVGDLVAEGRTPAQLDSIVTRLYGEIIVEPEVSVILRAFQQPDVFVLGRVKRPGKFPLQGPLTAVQAISMAGGLDLGANTSSVMLIRRGPEGAPVAERVDVGRVLKAHDLTQDVSLAAYDVVYVPETFVHASEQFIEDFFRTTRLPADWMIRWDDVFNLDERRRQLRATD